MTRRLQFSGAGGGSGFRASQPASRQADDYSRGPRHGFRWLSSDTGRSG